MIFADLFFLFLFLPVCLLCYYQASRLKTRNLILIIFSLIFYAWGEPLWVFLLIFSAFFNWFMALQLEKFKDELPGKILLAVALCVDLGFLFVFKYTGFFVETINAIFRTGIPVPSIRLPIGISFFTFQAISYVLDVYWETVPAQKKFRHFLLYLSFFPQLIAGPIVRYSDVEKELTKRRVTPQDFYEGSTRVVIGLTKKVLLANNLYTIVENFFGNGITGLSTLGTWYTVIIYSMYVYFDFSGYSDMAIGMGRLFGFHFNENFNYPFITSSIAEFWRRWHISLGSFFRDYLLYVPIFGKRRQYLNLFLVWFCTGMWHGASWNYILWGLYYGFWIFFEQKLGKKAMKKWPVWFKHLYSLFLIVIGFGIFYFEDFGQLGQFFLNITGISMIVNHSGFADPVTWSSLLNNLFLIALGVVACLPVLPRIRTWFHDNRDTRIFKIGKISWVVICGVALVICSIALVDATNNPFLYWRF
ncbi:MAG: MBOAT family O-acyltransferase [Lachnospiraceae bacterium]|nr:MBOAT family O-acyltransferase [Lachnospiraceae bacterium]